MMWKFVFLSMLCMVYAQSPPMDTDTVNDIKGKIKALIESNDVGTRYPFIAGFVRLAFHDCVNGCDGCVNLDNADNTGLARYIEQLHRMYEQGDLDEFIGLADFYALASIVALEKAAEFGNTTINVSFSYNRTSCENAGDINNAFPNSHGDLDHVLDFFANEFGFTARETVALMGAHTLGRARPGNSGFDGPWVGDTDRLTNAYYRELNRRNTVWTQREVSPVFVNEHKWQWNRDSPDADGRPQGPMMLNTDMCFASSIKLVEQVDGSIDGESQCNPAENCADSVTSSIVREYARDNDLWVEEFSAVFTKMINHVKPAKTLLTPSPSTTIKETRGHYHREQPPSAKKGLLAQLVDKVQEERRKLEEKEEEERLLTILEELSNQ